jgi:hypothetical protein
MTTGYSTLTRKEVRRDINKMKKVTGRIASSRKKAVALLVSAGILERDGKRLARRYR